MNLRTYAKTIEKLITDHSTEILTVVGVVGTVATGVLSVRSTVKAVEVLEDENLRGENAQLGVSKQDIVKATWKLYLPPIGVAAVTCAAIILSNRISAKRLTALGAAYTLADKAHNEYKDKVKEMIGDNKDQKVHDAIAQDKINANPPDVDNMFQANGGNVPFMDAFSGRYFKSDMETVKAAINNVNHSIVKGDYASLNDLYSWLGLASIPPGDEVGWNNDSLIDPVFSTGTSEDGTLPVHVVSFRAAPRTRYDKVFT